MTKRELILKKIEPFPEEILSEILDYVEFLEMKYLKEKFYVSQTPENGIERFFGKWPGKESDEEWNEMLEKLS